MNTCKCKYIYFVKARGIYVNNYYPGKMRSVFISICGDILLFLKGRRESKSGKLKLQVVSKYTIQMNIVVMLRILLQRVKRLKRERRKRREAINAKKKTGHW